MKLFYRFMFHLAGWNVSGRFPDLKKYIIAVAPHTSNWDFPVGLAGRSILNISHAKFLAKSQLFKPPFGALFRALGGYPVDRSSSHDMVSQVVDIFNKHENFVLAIAPEGTRKKVERLKTGFYYIAKSAGVPIVPCGFDFRRKEIVVGQPLFPTGNVEADLAVLYAFYRGIAGRNPELGIS